MKPTANYDCDCVEKAIAKLAEHNTTFDTVLDPSTGEVFLRLAVCKIDSKKRGKPISMALTDYCCPFCGKKTKDE